jgi:predicted nuclease with TOPRIM domain
LKRRDVTNEKLKEMTAIQTVEFEQKEADFKDTIDEKDEIIARLNEKLDSALEAKAQKLKLYYKSKAMFEKKEGKGHLLSKVSELKSRIVELENDVEVLQEEIFKNS